MWYKCTCEASHVVDAHIYHMDRRTLCAIWVVHGGSKDIMCNVSFAWCAGWGRVFGGEHMCIIKNHDSPDAPSVHLRFSQARQHVVDFVHSYRLCLALPNLASLSLLVSLYYIPTMCGKYSCNLCRGVTGHTHWVRGWCEENACCVLYYHHSTTTPLRSRKLRFSSQFFGFLS